VKCGWLLSGARDTKRESIRRLRSRDGNSGEVVVLVAQRMEEAGNRKRGAAPCVRAGPLGPALPVFEQADQGAAENLRSAVILRRDVAWTGESQP